jgi:hypothetical protein
MTEPFQELGDIVNDLIDTAHACRSELHRVHPNYGVTRDLLRYLATRAHEAVLLTRTTEARRTS